MTEHVAGARAGAEFRRPARPARDQHRGGRPRGVSVATSAVVVVLGALLAGCAGAASTTSTSSTTSTTSTPPGSSTTTTSNLTANDPCVVGRWVSTVGEQPQTVGTETIVLKGGGGTVISLNHDGSYSADFSATRPYVGTDSQKRAVSLSVSGATSGTFTAQASSLSLVDTQTTLEVTLRVDGKVVSRVHPPGATSPDYTCTAGHLTLTSGGFSTGYVPAH